MKEPIWVRRDVVIAYHDLLLARHGGKTGMRNGGMLDSALSRPVNKFNYQESNLYELAASYGFGLITNHPFIDGNKRIGFATAVLFLELNGRKFMASEVEAVLTTLAVAAGELTETALANWFEANTEYQ